MTDWKKKLGGVGILTDADLADFTEAEQKVAQLMKDGEWHPGREVKGVTGQDEGLRRMRALRRFPWLVLERRRVGKGRLFEYRLRVSVTSPPKSPQKTLFN